MGMLLCLLKSELLKKIFDSHLSGMVILGKIFLLLRSNVLK